MKKLPTWAIYLADIMCIASALLIAFNYFILGVPMDTIAILLCCFMVLSATAIICTAQFFHFKYTKLSNENKDTSQLANIEENFQIIFKQVSAIKRDNSTLNSNFSSLLERYNQTKHTSGNSHDKVLAEFHAIKAKIEELETKFAKEDDLTRLKLEVEDSIDNFKADTEIELGKLDDIDSAVKELKNILEEISTKAEEVKEAQPEIEEATEEATKEDIEEIEEAVEVEEAEDIEDLYSSEDDEDYFDDFEEDDGVDPADDISQISLMSRALNNTQQSQSVLGSFAKIDKTAQKAEEIEEDDGFVDIEDTESFADLDEELDDDLADIMSLGEKCIESTLTINAMLGLGNKPYIRGTAPELSESEGILMEFVEIGKWRYSFKDLSGKAKVSIWLNDEKVSTNGEISISEGENLEIDVNFN